MLLYRGRVIKGSMRVGDAAARENFSFAENTTYGCGGNAKIAYYPQNLIQFKRVYRMLTDGGVPFVVLGNGSNVLASDKGFDGAVISTRKLKGIVRVGEDKIFCLAGTSVAQLLNYCRKRGLGGPEYLYGIPATVGGAAFMNAGVGNCVIGNDIISVRHFWHRTVIIDNKCCNFGYRYSTMRDINGVILGITLRVERCETEEIEKRIRYFKERRSHLPRGRSCGCVFKNPCGISAGKLIEDSGLCGLSRGRAEVSSAHGNFIINGGSSSDDVYKVISAVKKGVFDKFGVNLQEEVVYIGEFNDTDS